MKRLFFLIAAFALGSAAYAGGMDTQEQVDDSIQQQEDWSDELNPSDDLNTAPQEQEEIIEDSYEADPMSDEVQEQEEVEDVEFSDESSLEEESME